MSGETPATGMPETTEGANSQQSFHDDSLQRGGHDHGNKDSDSRSTTPSFADAADQMEAEAQDNGGDGDGESIDFLDNYIPSESAETAKVKEVSIDDVDEPGTGEKEHVQEVEQTQEEAKPEVAGNNESTTTLTKVTEEQPAVASLEVPQTKDGAENAGASASADEKDSLPTSVSIGDMESIDSEEQVSVIHHETPHATTIAAAAAAVSPKVSIEESKPEEEKPSPKWFTFEEPDFDQAIQNITSPQNMNLAYHRFQDNEHELELKSTNDKSDVKNSRNSLKKTFNEIKTGVTVTQNDALINGINWEFWSEVFNDYSSIVKNKQNELKINITNGVPKEIRGMVWQIICDSNSMKLKEFFINTKDIKSDFEKLIKRDLARTSFIKDSAIKEKIDDLFNIIKTYSLYDEEVGYTQGMAFITVPLLMNMESDEAFCMLVRLMFTYGFREFYLPDMPGLHLRIYQFDRLIEDTIPELHLHLKNQKIKSSMYAIQWFLTLFAYKFPLDMVLRIYDVVVAEGLESLLKFALNLMIKNKDHLLKLGFDDLLDFLKEKLFYYYLAVPDSSREKDEGETEQEEEEQAGESNTYQIDRFIKDSMEINILPITLNKYSAEFDEIDKLEKQREKQVKELQAKNGLLTKEIRKIEASYALLNKEHVEIATEMVNGKVKIGALEEDNKNLREEIEKLRTRLENLTSQKSGGERVDFSGQLSQGLDKEIQNAMDINLKVMDQNRILEDTLAKLEEENQVLNSTSHKMRPAKLGSMFGLKKGGKLW